MVHQLPKFLPTDQVKVLSERGRVITIDQVVYDFEDEQWYYLVHEGETCGTSWYDEQDLEEA